MRSGHLPGQPCLSLSSCSRLPSDWFSGNRAARTRRPSLSLSRQATPRFEYFRQEMVHLSFCRTVRSGVGATPDRSRAVRRHLCGRWEPIGVGCKPQATMDGQLAYAAMEPFGLGIRAIEPRMTLRSRPPSAQIEVLANGLPWNSDRPFRPRCGGMERFGPGQTMR